MFSTETETRQFQFYHRHFGLSCNLQEVVTSSEAAWLCLIRLTWHYSCVYSECLSIFKKILSLLNNMYAFKSCSHIRKRMPIDDDVIFMNISESDTFNLLVYMSA